ncbi:MAG: hypothetical protein V4736_08225 [Bdellovibrionota bacterium]
MKFLGFILCLFVAIGARAQYSSTYEMKESLKVGIGPVFGGAYGKWGVKLDLNIEEDDGVVTGVGGSDSYNSFNIGWKHDFDGTFTHIYSVLGYAHLFGGDRAPSNNEYLIEQLNGPDAGGNISEGLSVLGLGFQYNELGPELTGLSLFVEGNILHAWKSSKLIPTGTVGMTYFF